MARLRLIDTLQKDTRVIKVYRDSEWNEYVAQHWLDGQHLWQDDAHDDDKESIMGTAAAMLEYTYPCPKSDFNFLASIPDLISVSI